jgi:hypothetical protein
MQESGGRRGQPTEGVANLGIELPITVMVPVSAMTTAEPVRATTTS